MEHHQITISVPCQSHKADKLDHSIQQQIINGIGVTDEHQLHINCMT